LGGGVVSADMWTLKNITGRRSATPLKAHQDMMMPESM
jgi:hypothetical protein